MSLTFLNPLVQEVHSFVIFFFELGLNALILYILETVHLGVSTLCWILVDRRHRQLIWQERITAITYSVHVTHLLLHGIIHLLSLLSLFGKLDVVLVKNNLLNIMCWHLSHKQALSIAFFISLDYFIFEA